LLHVHHTQPSADRRLPALARAAGVPHLVVTEHVVGRAHSTPERAFTRRELLGADVVTVACGAIADSLVREYGVDRKRVRVVPHGADIPDDEAEWPHARALRDEYGAGTFKPLWVCASRLEEQKGQAVLIDALGLIAQRNLDFIAVLAGEGSQRAALERRARALGLGNKVHFVGQVEHLGPLLLAADACVQPSLWEGLPLGLLDALVRGRPVIASRVGGIPEVIEDYVHGRLVSPNDVPALAAALEDFHRKPDEARQLGRAAALRVRSEYTWPHAVEGFEAVYDEVLGLASFVPSSAADRPTKGGLR
jgi:glycosyltransferase involved in cell wall biosynthesis